MKALRILVPLALAVPLILALSACRENPGDTLFLPSDRIIGYWETTSDVAMDGFTIVAGSRYRVADFGSFFVEAFYDATDGEITENNNLWRGDISPDPKSSAYCTVTITSVDAGSFAPSVGDVLSMAYDMDGDDAATIYFDDTSFRVVRQAAR